MAWLSHTEDRQETAVLDIEGRTLWSATLDSTLSFSPSGNYLLTDRDEMDGSQAPAAFLVANGKAAWTGAAGPHYWQLAAAEDDTLAYYQIGQLQVFDLRRGRLLWKKAVPADPDQGGGRLFMSRNGATIAVQTYAFAQDRLEVVTQAYDRRGKLLFESRNAPVEGASNGVLLRAVSVEGGLLAVEDLNSFSILRAADGKELSRVPEAEARGSLSAFTEDLLAFGLMNRTRAYIEGVSGKNTVIIRGVDPLESTRAIIQTLDRYISTGIGYAVSIKPLRAYLAKHPEVMRGPAP